MAFNRRFDPLWLNADVALCDRRAAMLQLPLDKGNTNRKEERVFPCSSQSLDIVPFRSAEVTLQQALEGLAVSGFVAPDFMHDVVDGVEVESLIK